MGLAQMSALSGGRKYKRPYVEEINKQTKYLPAIYGQKKEDAYRDKMYGLQTSSLELQEDALKTQKKAQKRANTLGYINMGVGAGLGAIDAYPALKEVGKDVVDWFSPTDTFKGIGGVVSPSSGQTFGGLTGSTSPIDLVSGGYDVFKKFGEAGFGVAKGLYDSVVGDSIDIDPSFDALYDYI